MTEDRRLNWREACEILRCSKRMFYYLIQSGKLRAWRIKGTKRGLWVWESDVRKLLEAAAEE